jgi:6-phosphogluconolactonase
MDTYRSFSRTLVLGPLAVLGSCANGSAPPLYTEPGATTAHPGSAPSSGSRSTSGSSSSTLTGASSRGDDSTLTNGPDASVATSNGTSPNLEPATFVFTVSVGGVIRAMRLVAGAEPQQVGSFELATTTGDFFLTATHDGSRVFVSYARTVIALAFDAATSMFTQLDTAPTAGAGTFVELSPDASHVLVAHYNEGKATHLRFDGSQFGESQELTPGSKAHSARVHASGDWAYVPCLGSNHVAQYALGETLVPNTPPTVAVPGGPRHMTFHPNGNVAYILTELTGQAYTFAVEADGTLGPDPLDVDDVASDVEQPSGSDVEITPDGKHLYTFIRRSQNLHHFEVAANGTLTASGETTNFGQEVRAFGIAPRGDVLLGGGSAGVLYTYAIDADTGALTRIGDGVEDLNSIQATVIREVQVSL